LDLVFVGICSYGALIDRRGRVVWCCLPRFDGDPVFCSLVDGDARAGGGYFEVEIEDFSHARQEYLENTAVLRTTLYNSTGSAVVLTDFAPRFVARGRMFRPLSLVRRLRPIGAPRIRVRLRPRFNWGEAKPELTRGSNHVRYVGPDFVIRLTTNVPVSYLMAETQFVLEDTVDMFLGPDEPLSEGIRQIAHSFEEQTIQYWQTWVRRLALPREWQEAVIRAAITLKLCSHEETGAIVAAMTTSIPEAPNSGRNWDYRYCWLRDAFFVVRALNSLAEVGTMEDYLRYLTNIAAEVRGGHVQPVYGIGLESRLVERVAPGLAGYRGMGPVRVGNQAYEHFQHDVYGNVVLATAQAFFDRRLFRRPGPAQFEMLKEIGEQAWRLHDQPDAGLWELRTRARVHTSSSLMCWAACDRIAKIADTLGEETLARHWKDRAAQIKEKILECAWSDKLNSFVESFGGDSLDASLLLMVEVGFLPPGDPRFLTTLEAIGSTLRRGNHLYRYAAADDLGEPETAFNICTFWYIDALAKTGRNEEARELFEEILAMRNHLGLLSEDLDIESGELWGNYPQTYSLVGIINVAMRLSRRWEDDL
jgi:GH15 family glucan-1,4-alpha-glucosidase